MLLSCTNRFRLWVVVILSALFSVTGCVQRIMQPTAEMPPKAPAWETLAYSYPEPLPFPILGKLRSKAQVAYHERDYQSTHILLDHMFRVDPKRPDVMALKGWVFCQQSEFEEALLWLQRARGYLKATDAYDVLLAEAERDCRL